MITLNGGKFSDIDTYLLNALALSSATGKAFKMKDLGKMSRPAGVRPFHVTAMRAMGGLCEAKVKGEIIQSKEVRFVPTQAPRAGDLVIDTGEATGCPSPASVVPLVEALIATLVGADADSLIRLRGVNATPFSPSAFWLRETLAPMLSLLGFEAAVEIDKWGWFPDGGGEITLVVEGKSNQRQGGQLIWEDRGDLLTLWTVVALSSRLTGIGEQMVSAFKKATAADRLDKMEVEIKRVQSTGPGSGLFMAMEFEHVTAGFEGISYRGMSAAEVAEEAASTMSYYYWSKAAFEPELARALMIPFALSGQDITCTTSELTAPMRILEDLIPRFLPVTVKLTKHAYGGQIQISPKLSTVAATSA